ncbi:MAG: hypothetical protein GWN62_05350, partial [Aliifodinibius sp.]|nr:hypothetical protein [Fodinibius sp.]
EVLGRLVESGDTLNIIAQETGMEPNAPIGKNIIYHSGDVKNTKRGDNTRALAHEIGHTVYGGSMQDFPGQGGTGPVGN